jgi:hypothetical protein
MHDALYWLTLWSRVFLTVPGSSIITSVIGYSSAVNWNGSIFMDSETYLLINNQCELMAVSNSLSSFGFAGSGIWRIQLRFCGHTCQLPSHPLPQAPVIVVRARGCLFLLFHAQVESGFLWMPTHPLHGPLYIQFFFHLCVTWNGFGC